MPFRLTVSTQGFIFVLDVLLLLNLPAAYFHALIVETGFFCKTVNNKIYLPFQAFTSKIKPCRGPIRVNLLLHGYFICVHAFYLLYLS